MFSDDLEFGTSKKKWRAPFTLGLRMKSGRRLRDRKYTAEEIIEAHDYYKNEYDSWARGKKKADLNLKFFKGLEMFYSDEHADYICSELNINNHTLNQSIRQTEARIETYFKMKEAGRCNL